MKARRIHLLIKDEENNAAINHLKSILKRNHCESYIEVYCHTVKEAEKSVCAIYPDEIFYENLNENLMRLLVEVQILKDKKLDQFEVKHINPEIKHKFDQWDHDRFFYKQTRIVLRNNGRINPESIDEYIAVDGYQAIAKVLFDKTPQDVIDEISASGLRGRGGGGFSTGTKWQLAKNSISKEKYVICNADEGDPGAFMDRSVLEGDPHSIIEAMMIAAYAIGAHHGYIYIRAEYPVAVERLKIAINQAHEYGLLGKNILESEFNFDIEIRLGAGAFVCGEETALIASIEGKRGTPKPRPPYPSVSGVWGKPTIINNVETFANITPIILKGAKWFRTIGSEKSPGTKVFALGGKIKQTGLVEVSMGITLKEVVYDIGKGCPNNKKFKAMQTGGPSGGCITDENLDTPIGFDELVQLGSMMGSGGMIILDEDNCMVDVARFYMDFIVDESCGKCTPCRIGTKRLLEMLNQITEGNGSLELLDEMEELAYYIKENSLCGLGQTAANPFLSTYHNFKHEYIRHVVDKKCDSKVCKALLDYTIKVDLCKKCGICARGCPTYAISGTVGKDPFVIDPELCIRCGACVLNCKFDAIVRA
ncbi:MAG TPA: NADH-ubiquinone oxidoreductase-F iron-sulfur binding region domain-containing protein [Erysipelotrichaceae bacterium]|nr:NADH-ubiquinone oxidoreductase-F iron-sulfur binding region domain-containing protein [Erysipelotrichaceae bacterium]